MQNNMFLKDDLVKMVQNSKMKSCTNERIPISGEMYVSPNTRKRKKEDATLKSKLGYIIAGVVSVGTIAIGASVTSTIDFANEVRQEVNDTYTIQNIIGGQYVEKSEHDTEFRDYINDLNDFQVSSLFNETSEAMHDVGMISGSSNLEDVVDQMETNYLENSGRNK